MADPIDARGAAIWNDGTPANLRAAAMDALDWLDVLQKQAAYIRMPAEDTRRLMACRVALARQIRRPAPASGMAQAAGEGQQAEQKLAAAGVFKGADGLRRLAECQDFWDKQPYGTRLYFEDAGDGYLHRDVLRAAVQVLDASPGVAPSAQPTDEEIAQWADAFIRQHAYNRPVAIQIATEAAKWVRSYKESRNA